MLEFDDGFSSKFHAQGPRKKTNSLDLLGHGDGALLHFFHGDRVRGLLAESLTDGGKRQAVS